MFFLCIIKTFFKYFVTKKQAREDEYQLKVVAGDSIQVWSKSAGWGELSAMKYVYVCISLKVTRICVDDEIIVSSNASPAQMLQKSRFVVLAKGK